MEFASSHIYIGCPTDTNSVCQEDSVSQALGSVSLGDGVGGAVLASAPPDGDPVYDPVTCDAGFPKYDNLRVGDPSLQYCSPSNLDPPPSTYDNRRVGDAQEVGGSPIYYSPPTTNTPSDGPPGNYDNRKPPGSAIYDVAEGSAASPQPPPLPPPRPLKSRSFRCSEEQETYSYVTTCLPHPPPSSSSVRPPPSDQLLYEDTELSGTYYGNRSSPLPPATKPRAPTPPPLDGRVTNLGSGQPPPLPPRPESLRRFPDYVEVIEPLPQAQSPPPLPERSFPQDKPMKGNSNIVLVNVGKLVHVQNVQPQVGMPIYCTGCMAAISSLSNLQDQDQPDTVWSCEYCGVSNPVDHRMDLGEAGNDQTFLHLPDPATAQQPDHSLVIFCVDISGSMSVTLQVNPRANQQTNYMSRLQAVQEAVIQSFQYLLQTSPDKRVALVTFNDEVAVYGDGLREPRIFREFELMDQDYLKTQGLQEPLPTTIAESRASLEHRVLMLQEFGSTALGPASLISIAMASQRPGSKVIICTDGKANTALGNLEDIADPELYQGSKLFYQQLAEYAGQRGVVVSVLTIAGTDCRLQELGLMADVTGGKVNIVNPISLYNEFQSILEDDIIATNTTAIFVVNESLYFKHETGVGGSRLVRYVGNVTRDTEITFEFGIKEISKQRIHQMASLPFQLQLAFRLPDGRHGYRIVSLDKPTTSSSAIIKSNLNLSVLQIHSAQLSARLVMEGRLQEAHTEALAQKQLIEDVLGKRKDAEQEAIYESWSESMSPIHGDVRTQTQDGVSVNPIYEPLNTRQGTAVKSFSDDVANMVFKLKNAKKKMFKKPKFLIPI